MASRGKQRRSRLEGPDDLIAFGKRLKEYRLAQRFTQADVAGDRYSAAYISHLESGKRVPSNDALSYIAGRLGIDVEGLWGGRGASWAVEMAEDLRARGLPREAYELLERTLTNLERDGQVSGVVLSVMHRELGFSERPARPSDRREAPTSGSRPRPGARRSGHRRRSDAGGFGGCSHRPG